MTDPIQRYIDTPKPGHLPPQPNRDLAVTRLVMRLLGLR
jgi:hypothetical protein